MKNIFFKTLLLLFIVNNLIAETFVLSTTAKSFKDAEKFIRDNKKEVVIDTLTNLMWQDNKSVKTTKKNWKGAIKYCEELTFGGFSDWRLPEIRELISIVDYTKINPAIKNEFFNTVADFYWSSSAHSSVPNISWVVRFERGDDGSNNKGNINYVRCVRDHKYID